MRNTLRHYIHLFVLTLVTTMLTACGNDDHLSQDESESVESISSTAESTIATSETTIGQTNDSLSNQQGVEEFTPDYIAADDLNATFDANTIPYIFDVRSTTSYQTSHIETALSMPYGQTTDEMLAAVDGMDKSSEIITYCGCPRHLASLSAKDLIDRGYTNVRALYEGYWHWIDSGYPIFEAEKTASLTHLQFEGSLSQAGIPTSGKNLFLKHRQTGQLEAVRTNQYGQFTVDFHLYDYQKADVFEIIVDDIQNSPVQLASAEIGAVNLIEVNL